MVILSKVASSAKRGNWNTEKTVESELDALYCFKLGM